MHGNLAKRSTAASQHIDQGNLCLRAGKCNNAALGEQTLGRHSYIHDNNGIIISHWQGEFRMEGMEEEYMTFKGRDVNKNGKFVVLRTYFTKSHTLGWMNGLVCILSGKVETSPRVFKSTGYELIL